MAAGTTVTEILLLCFVIFFILALVFLAVYVHKKRRAATKTGVLIKEIILLGIESFLIFALVFLLVSDHFVDYDSDIWFQEDSPYGRYSLTAFFPDEISIFGPTDVHFLVFDHEEQIKFIKVELFVYDHGKSSGDDNYKLEWHEDYVEITVIHHGGGDKYDGKSNSARIYWEDN